MSVTLGALVVAISTEFSVLLSERHRRERIGGHAPREALLRAYASTGAAVLASAVTAIAGFAVLVLSDIRMLREFGAVTVVDLTVSLLGVLVVRPAVLTRDERGASTILDLGFGHRACGPRVASRRRSRTPLVPEPEPRHEPAPRLMAPDPQSATRDSRYAWRWGAAGVLVVSLFTVSSLRGEGSGPRITAGGEAPRLRGAPGRLGARRGGRQRRHRRGEGWAERRGQRARLLGPQSGRGERLRALRARAGDRRVLRDPQPGVRRSSRAEHVAFY